MSEPIVTPGCTFMGNIIACVPGYSYDRSTWNCPECHTPNARRITSWPNYFMYLPGLVYCECGDVWDPEEGRMQRPFRRNWRAEQREHFEHMWAESAPDGSRFGYDDDGYLVVTTPDGTKHTAWGDA